MNNCFSEPRKVTLLEENVPLVLKYLKEGTRFVIPMIACSYLPAYIYGKPLDFVGRSSYLDEDQTKWIVTNDERRGLIPLLEIFEHYLRTVKGFDKGFIGTQRSRGIQEPSGSPNLSVEDSTKNPIATCGFCHSTNVTYYELQTRSEDVMKEFFACKGCNFQWTK